MFSWFLVLISIYLREFVQTSLKLSNMEQKTFINMNPKDLEDLLYEQKWKDLEVISIDVEEENKVEITWRDLVNIEDKVCYDSYGTVEIFIDETGLHVNHHYEFLLVCNEYTRYTYPPEAYDLFINYLLEQGPQLIYDFAESIEYIDKKESHY